METWFSCVYFTKIHHQFLGFCLVEQKWVCLDHATKSPTTALYEASLPLLQDSFIVNVYNMCDAQRGLKLQMQIPDASNTILSQRCLQ